jgi:hypothetical protein
MRSRIMSLVVIGTGLALAGCSQQTEADLAVCKSDLTAAQAAQTAAQQRVAVLEQQLASNSQRLAQLENAPAQTPARTHPQGTSKTPSEPPATTTSQPPPAPLSPEQRRTQKF